MNGLIAKKGVYTVRSSEPQTEYTEFYPVSVLVIIEALKNSTVTPVNKNDFKTLFEDIPVCNNIAHMNNKAIRRDNLMTKFWKSNTRIKEFLFLQDINEKHKIGFSYAQYITLKLLCEFDPCVDAQMYDTQKHITITTEDNTDIMIVNLDHLKQMMDKINKCYAEKDMINFELNDFVNYIPVCLNFIIDFEKHGGKIVSCSLYEITNYFRNPQCQDVVLTLKRCIEMTGKTNKCEIGLSMVQYDIFKKMCDNI